VRLPRSSGSSGTDSSSDAAEGNVKMGKILLNGNNICMVGTGIAPSTWAKLTGADGARRKRQEQV
jgi:hypothetical protein